MSYIKLNKFILNWFENEPLINTISNFKENEIDVNVNTIFPLFNFYINNSSYDQATIYKVDFFIYSQVDIVPEVNNSKLIDSTNHIDIINEVEHVVFRFLNYLRERNNTDDILMDSVTEINYIKSENRNGLSGAEFSIDFTIPNETLNY